MLKKIKIFYFCLKKAQKIIYKGKNFFLKGWTSMREGTLLLFIRCYNISKFTTLRTTNKEKSYTVRYTKKQRANLNYI